MSEQLQHLPIQFTTGDRLPELSAVLKGYDLTGHTVTMTLARPSGVLSKNATLTDPTNGAFKFSWASGDLETGLGQEALIRLTTPSTLVQTLARFIIDVCAVPSP